MITYLAKAYIRRVQRKAIAHGDQPSLIRRAFERMGRRIPVRKEVQYTPFTIADIQAERITPLTGTTKGVLLWIHGGGYAIGSLSTHRNLAAKVAEECAATTIVFNYRLAPEHPYPAALHDCMEVYTELLKTTRPEELILIGDSAGGGLVLSLLTTCREQNIAMPKAAVVISPWTDLTNSAPSIIKNQHKDPMLYAPLMPVWASWYVAGHTTTDPKISPLFADLSALPPLLIQTSPDELIYDDSKRLHERAVMFGIDVTLEEYPGMMHVFQFLYPFLKEARTAIRNIAKFTHQHWTS